MGRLIFVVGFPRTATTKVFEDICGRCRGCPCVFEPFNPEVVYNWVVRGFVHHDVVGNVMIRGVSEAVVASVVRNVEWVISWRRGRGSFCGDWVSVLRDIAGLGDVVVVKDVYFWPLLPALKRALGSDVFVVSTIRGKDYVESSFAKLFRLRCVRRGRLREMFRSVRRLVRGGIMNLSLSLMVNEFFGSMCSEGVLGLGDFFRFFYGGDELRRLREENGLDGILLISYLLDMVYPIYERFVEVFSDYVIYFDKDLVSYGVLFDRLEGWLGEEGS